MLFSGADGGTRTHTVSLPTDFESVTSANSITSACLVSFIIISPARDFGKSFVLRIGFIKLCCKHAFALLL